MKKVNFLVLALLCLFLSSNGQTPIVMSAQSGYSYTETFSDITNWTFTLPLNGTFSAGVGATAWKGTDISAVGAVPSANKLTAATYPFQDSATSTSSGLYKADKKMGLLATGTTDNSTAVAVDFMLDFTSVNAGTLSFDWASVNNGANTSNRKSSLRVYASTDGVNFTEITTAQVLNVTNFSPTAGSNTNVTLPSSFNGSATARLRFYYYNGTGGSSGSRPRLNLDNVKVTAVPTTPCTSPTAQPTNFVANTVIHNSIQFSYTAASPAPQNYLVVMSNNSSLSSNPVNGTTYNIGDNLGDGNVIAVTSGTTVTATGLTNSHTYHFFVFSINNVCTGGPLYAVTNPLHGSATTLAGALNCAAPTSQPTNITFNNVTTTSISGTFTAAVTATDEYLIVRSNSSTFSGTLNNGTNYAPGNVLGNGTVVAKTAATNFTVANLNSGTQYYFFVFGVNSQNCNNGPAYNSSTPLTGNTSTVALPVCSTPAAQPTDLNLYASTAASINGYFTSSNADGYLVVRSTSPTLSATPVNGTNYTVGATLGNGTVVTNAAATSFIDNGLSTATLYYYFVFARNSTCTGTVPMYLTTGPATNFFNTNFANNNYYFGNLHAHSYYSDGNQDNPSFTPANDYAYAKNSLCLDFLGISEHNHSQAGMSLPNYQLGINQAAAATTSNFLALYGMEYGVISNGGHVLIYGVNQLIGWENNNYNIYVPKSDYTGTPETTGITGLFRTINNFGNNSFATFAHPDFSDYNNLANTAYNISADSAVIGTAVASGPAFSTGTTYNDPPSSMAYLDYYNKMLSKGYHLGPLMDHDSHYTNFGRSSSNRLAVIAPSLSSSDFMNSMRNMHFYATEDCDTKVNFTLNNLLMGNIAQGTTPPAISIYAVDPTSSSTVPTIKLMYGIAASGVLPVQVAIANAYTLSFTDNGLPIGTEGYYFADISIGSNRTITAPIWYTKTAAVPVTLLSFNASLNNNRTVQLQWKTSNEINNKMFVVEKSTDGVSFSSFTSVDAKNGSMNTYSIVDAQPFDGINYYRLKQVDKNGSFKYSNIVSVNLKKSDINAFNVYPNPVKDLLTLNINSIIATKATVLITDISGRIINQQTIDLVKGNQSSTLNLTNLKQGNYQITLIWDNEKITQRLVKL
jgi:hypothetical protein